MPKRPLILIFILINFPFLSFCKSGEENLEPIPIVLEQGKPFFFNYGLVKEPKSFSIPISSSEINQILLIENPHINRISISFLKRDTILTLGDHLPFDKRPIKFRQFAIPIYPLAEVDTIFLEVDKSKENLSIGLRLFDEESFNDYQKQDDRLIGFILGVSFLTFLIGIVLLSRILSKKTLVFLSYIVLSLFWLLNDAGLFYQFIWPKDPLFHSLSRGLFSTSSMALFAFYVYQNKNERINNAIKKSFKGIVFFVLFKLLFSFVLGLRIFPDVVKGYYTSVNSVVLLFLFGLLLCLLVKEFFKRGNNFFELGAIFVYCSFVFSTALSELGVNLIRIPILHQFDALVFLVLQVFFMMFYIKNEETRQKLKSLQEFTDFQISQERRLKRRIIEVEEFERKRIAQNIHDDIGSILVSVKYLIFSLQEKFSLNHEKNYFSRILNVLDEGVRNQYSIIDDLMFKFDKNDSLEVSIRSKMSNLFSEMNIYWEVVFKAPENFLNSYQKTQLYRIVTELITNTIKHSKNTSFVFLKIENSNPIEIFYSDNGTNYGASANLGGRGLENIKFRIKQLNGELLGVKFCNGFIIKFIIPLSDEKNQIISD